MMKKNAAFVVLLICCLMFFFSLFIVLPQFSHDPSEVAAAMIPCVVCIQNYAEDENDEPKLISEGSGFFISENGLIATNAHVVRNAAHLKVILSDGRSLEAKLLGQDTGTDLAALKINETGCPAVKIGNTEQLSAGDTVMAIGNPGGYDFAGSVSMGIVSASKRPIALSEFGYTLPTIQTDAAINPGNSGGPLVDKQGKVVGICSAKYAKDGFEGMGFAISIDEAIPILNALIKYGEVPERSVLGVSGFCLDQATAKEFGLPAGFYVDSIRNENAAFLQKGDVILEIDGNTIDSPVVIKDTTLDKKPGDYVTLVFFSAKDRKTHEARLILIRAA